MFNFWYNPILFAIIFPLLACFFLPCDFHRGQAWDCLLSAHVNGMQYSKEILLVHLQHIASTNTVEELKKNVKILKEVELWKLEESKRFGSWIEETCLPDHKPSFQLEVAGRLSGRKNNNFVSTI